MNRKGVMEAQAFVSLIPYKLTYASEGDCFIDILKDHNNDIEDVNRQIRAAQQRINDFYRDEYLPQMKQQKKK